MLSLDHIWNNCFSLLLMVGIYNKTCIKEARSLNLMLIEQRLCSTHNTTMPNIRKGSRETLFFLHLPTQNTAAWWFR